MMELEAEKLVVLLFGGREKLDCWITRAADWLTDPDKAKPVFLPVTLPRNYIELLHRPREALDLMLEKLEDLGVWGYTISVQDGQATVTDDLTGHVLEAAPIVEWPQIHDLAQKYGQNVKVVKELRHAVSRGVDRRGGRPHRD
jgi:hypothetical protein